MRRSLPHAALALLCAVGCERSAAPGGGAAVARTERAATAAARPQGPTPGSRGEGAPHVALLPIGEGPPLVTDVEFVPGAPRKVVLTSQRGRAELLELPAAPGERARPAGRLLELEVDSESELGLLSIAFHPRYPENGRLFVHYNPKGRQLTRIAELELPLERLGKSAPRERRVLLEVAQPHKNHNGGELAFGPDGKLYLGLGDGGAFGDPRDNGQDVGTLLGTILRLEVDGKEVVPRDNPFVDRKGARPEIFAYGLRNPWKLSFDERGRLIVGDVGERSYEEVDIIVKGGNYGWNAREGAHCFEPKEGCAEEGLIDPVFEYGHDLGISVTGGYVYTGRALPELRGRYVMADFGTRRMWALTLPDTPTGRAKSTVLGVFEPGSAALGRDHEGELYVSDYGSGRLYKLVRP